MAFENIMTTLATDLGPTRTPDTGAATGEVRDYVALLKPRVMVLVVFTALVGMVVTHPDVHPVLAFGSLVMIAVGAGASGCLNMWWDAESDALMTRTRARPIPAGRIGRDEALSFGLTLACGSVLALGLIANWMAAAFLAFTIVFYAVIYSMWLKRSTAQNIVIGGAAGAFPPMIGEAAVSGTVGVETFILFLVIFLWTPPHFWALALVKSERLRPRRHPDDAQRRRAGQHPPTDPRLYRAAGPARLSPLSSSASAALPTRRSPCRAAPA